MHAQKRRLHIYFSALALLGTATSFWLHAQAADTRPIPSLMPGGALMYLEAKDFGGLLKEWNGSAEKKRWLQSANYRVLSLSRLVQRLSQAQGEFAALAGRPLGMNLTDQVAGGRSGFAFYNLSALSFVYITQMPAGRIESTSLWRDRTRYQSREVAGIPFYVKTDEAGARTIAFTSYKGWFILSTDEDRMAGTLVLLSGAKTASLATESWFVAAAKQSASQGDLRLVSNVHALLVTPQFRTYWIHRNASELKPFDVAIQIFLRAATVLRNNALWCETRRRQRGPWIQGWLTYWPTRRRPRLFTAPGVVPIPASLPKHCSRLLPGNGLLATCIIPPPPR